MRVRRACFFISLAGLCLFASVSMAAPPTHTISGTVATTGGTGVEGVDVVGDNGATATVTAADGTYSITVPNHWDGTVIPVGSSRRRRTPTPMSQRLSRAKITPPTSRPSAGLSQKPMAHRWKGLRSLPTAAADRIRRVPAAIMRLPSPTTGAERFQPLLQVIASPTTAMQMSPPTKPIRIFLATNPPFPARPVWPERP
jgi:hypothetical protein